MEFSDFFDHCKTIFEVNCYLPIIDDEKAHKLFLLTKTMLETNKVMNLTAITDEKTIILRHYADSLAISSFFAPNSSIIDIGCGAGFPSLPLAIFRPDLKITSIDSTAKRIEYVNRTAKMLQLDNITAIAERAEILGNSANFRETFDYATARAVASLPILTELCLPFVKLGGQFVAMKAQKGGEELSHSHNAITKCGGKLLSSNSISLLDIDGSAELRTIITISKATQTPKEFPRHYSKISKKPL